MKKTLKALTALLLCAVMLCSVFACGKQPDKNGETTQKAGEQTQAQEQTQASETPTAASAQTEAPTEAPAQTEASAQTEAPAKTEAPEQTVDVSSYYEDMIDLFERGNTAEDHTAVQAGDNTELACKFTIEEGTRITGLFFEACPTWSDNGNGTAKFVVEFYKWDSDYETTLMNQPLESEEFEDWIDNAACSFLFDKRDGYPSGTYLWVFRGITSWIGIWAMNPADGCVYFNNGFETRNGQVGYRCCAMVLIPD